MGVTSAAFSDEVLQSSHIRALDVVQAMLDLASFAEGVPFTGLINAYIDPSGNERPLVVADRRLAALCTAFAEDELESVLLDVVLDDHPLRQVLADLNLAISRPHYAPIACGRVVDSLRRMITDPSLPDKTAWANMREVLRADETYLQFVTGLSRGPRHGHRVEVSGADNSELVTRAWTLVDRYFAYILTNQTPLPVDGFPVLTG